MARISIGTMTASAANKVRTRAAMTGPASATPTKAPRLSWARASELRRTFPISLPAPPGPHFSGSVVHAKCGTRSQIAPETRRCCRGFSFSMRKARTGRPGQPPRDHRRGRRWDWSARRSRLRPGMFVPAQIDCDDRFAAGGVRLWGFSRPSSGSNDVSAPSGDIGIPVSLRAPSPSRRIPWPSRATRPEPTCQRLLRFEPDIRSRFGGAARPGAIAARTAAKRRLSSCVRRQEARPSSDPIRLQRNPSGR